MSKSTKKTGELSDKQLADVVGGSNYMLLNSSNVGGIVGTNIGDYGRSSKRLATGID